MAGLSISLAVAADPIFLIVAVTYVMMVCFPPRIVYPTHEHLHFTLRGWHVLSHDDVLH